MMGYSHAHHGVPAASAYTGPGDVVSGATAWWGLRGYNAAYATGSNPALDIVDQAGANQLTVNILSTGRLDVASINTWVTANSVSTIKVKKAYDQTGNTRHMTQATLANMPVLNLTGFGSLPAIVFTTGSSHQLVSGSITQAQPLTFSLVFNKTANTTDLFASGGSIGVIRFPADSIRMVAGSPVDIGNAGTTDNAWHAGQIILNGASGNGYFDGTATTANAGTTGLSSVIIWGGSGGAFTSNFDGSFAEFGLWGSAFTTSGGGQADLINANQHGTNGHNF